MNQIAKKSLLKITKKMPSNLSFDQNLSKVITTPIDKSIIVNFEPTDILQYNNQVSKTMSQRNNWKSTPTPIRGQVVHRIGELLRQHKNELANLITMEVGKIHQESLGEVQEAIDICDFAVGLSRTLNGQVIPSERPNHVILERWNPLDNCVGIISAFNFPCAVFFLEFGN